MASIRNFYILMAVLGVVVPWYFFAGFILQNGMNIGAFLKALFVNGAAGGFSADIFLTATVFWVWSFLDAKKEHIKGWSLVVPATFFVGLSLALPLYLILRSNTHKAKEIAA